jgi:hypothetical protein
MSFSSAITFELVIPAQAGIQRLFVHHCG